MLTEWTFTDGTHDPMNGNVSRWRTIADTEAEARDKIATLYPSLGDLELEAAWSVRICATHYVSYRTLECFVCEDERTPVAPVLSPFVRRAMAGALPAKAVR
jgi:ubiquitin C-terminal hydrolase